jgi:hypothetical protein
MVDLIELKESLKLLYTIVGPDMPAIGMVCLKLVDVIQDISEGRDPVEDIQSVKEYMYRIILSAMADRAITLNLPSTYNDLCALVCIEGTWAERKLVYLKTIARTYRAFAQKTGCKYPEVVTTDGIVL